MLTLTSFVIGCIALLKLAVQDIYRYKRLLGERGILEYSQALILFISAWIGWLFSKDFLKRLSMRLHSVVYANCFRHAVGWPGRDCLGANPVRLDNT